MIPIACAVLCGALLLQSLGQLPQWPLAVPLIVLAIACAGRRNLRLLAWGIGAFLLAWGQAGQRLALDLPAELEGVDLLVRGTIISLPETDGPSTRFRFQAEARQLRGEWISFKPLLRLSWHAAPAVRAGEGWQLKLRLKRRHGFRNPGGFDYAGWLLQNDIAATGYVRAGPESRAIAALATERWDVRLRAAVDRRLQTALEEVPAAGLLRALSVGATDGLDAHDWEMLRATGTSHLISISGLHIGLVAGLGFVCGRWLWSRGHRLTQRLAAPRAGAVTALLAATVYAMLAGFSIPTQRAWLMAFVLLGGTLAARPGRAPHSLALALIVVVASDPSAVLAPGFWLSFVAVAIIFMQQARQPAVPGIRGTLAHLIRMQFALTVGLLPLTLLFFGQSGWVAPLANLFAVPWTSFLLVPMLFAALLSLYPLPTLAQWLFLLAGWLGAAMLRALEWLAQLPGAVVGMPEVPLQVSAAALVGAALLLLPRGTPQRWLGGVLLLPLLSWTAPRPAPGTAWFSLLDVGQGLAAVIQTARHTLVYDTGPRFGDFDTGAAVVVPFLAAQGVDHVDMLIVSHGDNDHSGGAEAVDRRFPVYRMLSSVPQQFPWRRANRCHLGQEWNWDGVAFRMVHPADRGGSDNDGSCVLLVTAADGTQLLLPGDIEAGAERELVARYGTRLRSRIVVAPHHGSRTSSTPPFVAAVAPDYVLFAAGYRNRYGFPNPRVLTRYEAQGSRALITADTGAIRFRLGADEAPKWERAQRPRYWDRGGGEDPAVPPGQ